MPRENRLRTRNGVLRSYCVIRLRRLRVARYFVVVLQALHNSDPAVLIVDEFIGHAGRRRQPGSPPPAVQTRRILLSISCLP